MNWLHLFFPVREICHCQYRGEDYPRGSRFEHSLLGSVLNFKIVRGVFSRVCQSTSLSDCVSSEKGIDSLHLHSQIV